MREFVLSLSDGGHVTVVMQWEPTPNDIDSMEDWFQLILRMAKRSLPKPSIVEEKVVEP